MKDVCKAELRVLMGKNSCTNAVIERTIKFRKMYSCFEEGYSSLNKRCKKISIEEQHNKEVIQI
jgi:hypothetical protein